MNPTLQYELMNARIADLHRQAQRDRVAQAASATHRARASERTHRVRGLPALVAQRVRTALGSPL